jgi:hypothetical protein
MGSNEQETYTQECANTHRGTASTVHGDGVPDAGRHTADRWHVRYMLAVRKDGSLSSKPCAAIYSCVPKNAVPAWQSNNAAWTIGPDSSRRALHKISCLGECAIASARGCCKRFICGQATYVTPGVLQAAAARWCMKLMPRKAGAADALQQLLHDQGVLLCEQSRSTSITTWPAAVHGRGYCPVTCMSALWWAAVRRKQGAGMQWPAMCDCHCRLCCSCCCCHCRFARGSRRFSAGLPVAAACGDACPSRKVQGTG